MKGEQLRFSLIICTYERSASLKRLLDSVERQKLYPDEILIIDGSVNDDTKGMLEEKSYERLKYHRVGDADRGLTKQRNFGIERSGEVDIICFLDDDIVLKCDYFYRLIPAYNNNPDAVAIGGWIDDETTWTKPGASHKPKYDEFLFDGYVRKLGQRQVLRKRLGLSPDKAPGFMPEFSHGFSTGFLPPSGKVYEVEYFMGGVSSYRKEIFKELKFSSYFEGYGLYEDMDFCLRASETGKLYVHTGAQVYHLHEESGRPDYFKYGQMVIKNGYYVWKLKHPGPSTKAMVKWNLISLLLMIIRFKNDILDSEKGSGSDAKGRFKALLELAFRRSEKQ